MRLFALSALLLVATAAHAAEPITGRWLTGNGKGVVAIGQCGPTVCGRITRILASTPGGAVNDTRNPDPRLRDRPILGLEMLTGFTDAGKEWRGRIYDPQSGKSYKSILSREPGGLKVQGCVMMFCQTQHWTPAR